MTHPCFLRKVIVAGLPRESLPTAIGKSRQRTSVFFCCCGSNARCAQGQPKKELDRTTKAISQ